jgi:hypothetical protein
MNERKIKICVDLRQWIFSKRDLWRQASEAAAACDSEKDKWYLDGVKDIYDVFGMMIDNFEEDPKQEDPMIFIGQIINHSSGRVAALQVERGKAESLTNRSGALREGMIYAWNEVLNFAREIRSNVPE